MAGSRSLRKWKTSYETKIKSMRSFHRVIRRLQLCCRSFSSPSPASSTPTLKSTLFGCPFGTSPAFLGFFCPRPSLAGSSSTSYIRSSKSLMRAVTMLLSACTSTRPARVERNHSQLASFSALLPILGLKRPSLDNVYVSSANPLERSRRRGGDAWRRR